MKPLEIALNLFEKYEGLNPKMDNYYGLLSVFALEHLADVMKDDKLIDKCRKILLKYPDEVEHPYYNYENYKIGGAAQGWFAMKGYMTERNKEIDSYASITLKAVTDDEGIVCRPDRYPAYVQTWVDSIYAVCPFMLYAGILTCKEEYIDFSVEQCVKMYDRFMDNSCGLLHQSKGFMLNPDEISQDHWSRGNGWGYFGLTEFVKYLPEDSKYRDTVLDLFIKHSGAILNFQDNRGLWRQEMTSKYSWTESSGSALFLYGFGAGIRLGILEREKYMTAFEKGMNALTRCAIKKNYDTMHCCHGCLCPGNGTVEAYLSEVSPLQNDPHSFGPFIMALVEAHLLGIKELEIDNMRYYWQDFRKRCV